jgi:hypothetical protein
MSNIKPDMQKRGVHLPFLSTDTPVRTKTYLRLLQDYSVVMFISSSFSEPPLTIFDRIKPTSGA